jgi:DNA polymerase-3 subunit beta
MTCDEGRLKLSATDLDIAINTWIGAKIDQEGATTVPARLITDFVASLPSGHVTLDIPERGRQLHLSCGRTESVIHAMDPEDFPMVGSVTGGDRIEMKGSEFRAAVDFVSFAAAADESRPVLTGVHLRSEGKRLELAAADGFRLAVAGLQMEREPDAPLEITVPARAMREVARLISEDDEPVEMQINKERTQVRFSLTDTELVALLIQGTYPNYRQLIPDDYGTRCTIDAATFKQEARTAAIFARDGNGIVRLQMYNAGGVGQLQVNARADEVGDNTGVLDVELDGDDAKVAFNSRYLTEVLDVLEGTVGLETSSPSSPGVFRPIDPEADYVHVIMPMFVEWGNEDAPRRAAPVEHEVAAP